MKYSYIFTHIFAVISVCLVVDWATDSLGGLYTINMDDPTSDNYKYVFNWHPVMMVLGMLFCFVEAALSYRTWKHLDSMCKMKMAKLIHLVWQTAAVICISVGLYAVFTAHNKNNKPNLYSLHSWIGISVVTLYFTQYVVGVYTFLTPKSVSPISQRENYKPYHIYFGLFLLFGAGMAIETGIQDKLAGSACNYPVTEPDTNPIKNYSQIPLVCKEGNWLGLSVFVTLMFAGLSLFESDSKNNNKKDESETSVNRGLLETEAGQRI